jgi:hypothetical protein
MGLIKCGQALLIEKMNATEFALIVEDQVTAIIKREGEMDMLFTGGSRFGNQ